MRARRSVRLNPARNVAVLALTAFLAPLLWAEGSYAVANDPLTVVVSLEAQRMVAYRGTEPVFSSPVSTGRQGYATPAGVFSILQKRRWHRSNIYSQAPMPYMQRLTWSGIALHAGHLPGYPASHGCIRLPTAEAKALFAKTAMGAHVVVIPKEIAPQPITHPLLFQPAPPQADPSPPMSASRPPAPVLVADAGHTPPAEISDAVPAAAEVPDRNSAARIRALDEARRAYAKRPREPLRVYITRRTGRERVADMQKLLAELGHDPGEIDGLMGPNTSAAIRSFERSIGIATTGAYSEALVETLYHAAGVADPAEAHLYVRQDFKPLFEAPVRLRDPGLALGTHLFTALHFEDGVDEAGWLAVSAQPAPEATAAQVLDRIEISPAIRARISALLTPGSSLLVSDHGLGLETGARGTDFIVLTE